MSMFYLLLVLNLIYICNMSTGLVFKAMLVGIFYTLFIERERVSVNPSTPTHPLFNGT